MEARVPALHADVDVEPAHSLPPGRDARVLDELDVARLVCDLLILRPADRVTSGGREPQPALLRERKGSSPQLGERLTRLPRGLADPGVELERRSEELALERPERSGEPEPLRSRDQLGRTRHELERLAVYHHQLLLDADREGRGLTEVRLDHAPSVAGEEGGPGPRSTLPGEAGTAVWSGVIPGREGCRPSFTSAVLRSLPR